MSKKSHRASHARPLTLLIAGLLMLTALAGLVVGARAWRTSANVRTRTGLGASPPTPILKPATAVQRQRPIAQMETELITITPHGFEPREIARPHGKFLLMIDNRSGVAATLLQLTRDTGARTHEMRVPRESPNWSDVVDLQPGRYQLTEADHPRWSCRITITAQ